ncbi:MAG: hypothetical protein AAF514_07275 [Verrucomicrobiota bacterium]
MAQALQVDLETTYNQWRRAMMAGDFKGWQAATATSRQHLTRNLIVSQKKLFPKALFDLPMDPPALVTLRMLQAKQKGPTARSVYYGRVDFGIGANKAPENLLILKFIKERGGWKFDTSSFMRLDGTPEIRQQARTGNLKFLKEPPFQPSGRLRPIPKPCPVPDYVADLHIVSLGYDSEIELNGYRYPVYHNVNTEIAIGGLKKGLNPISMKMKPTKLMAGEKRIFKVSVHVKTGKKRNPAIKVFEYNPTEVPPSFSSAVKADKTTIKGRVR